MTGPYREPDPDCERCGGDGFYNVCIDGECDTEGCSRECACTAEKAGSGEAR